MLFRSCKSPYEISIEHASRLGLETATSMTLHRSGGCPQCGQSGYRGRTTIVEILPLTDTIRELVLRRAPAAEISRAAMAQGMRSMFAHGMQKALAGITSVDEVLAATRAT